MERDTLCRLIVGALAWPARRIGGGKDGGRPLNSSGPKFLQTSDELRFDGRCGAFAVVATGDGSLWEVQEDWLKPIRFTDNVVCDPA